jgi:hypothetical protein
MTQNIDALLAERGNTHGDYAEHAAITQALKDIMRSTPGWTRLNDIMKETLEMHAHKAGRILAGDPTHADHWDDIAGYARLVSTRLTPIVAAHSPTPAPHPMMREAMSIIDDGAAEMAAKYGANARNDTPTS